MTLTTPEPKAVNIGCGYHVPVRWSRLCVLYTYEKQAQTSKYFEEKTFPMPMVTQTLSGIWEFHGERGRAVLDRTTVVVGLPGTNFGCRHEAAHPTTAYIAYLKPGALDQGDEPLFGEQVMTGLRLPDLKRALSLETVDEFDSFIFEAFGLASCVSLGGHPRRERSHIRVQRMKRFIEHHAFESITLSDLATCLDLSPFTCMRLFKSRMGLTPQRYLNDLRLVRAQELLRDRRLTIADVAFRVGIRDRFYFTRWFSKKVGVPPQRFREIVND